MSLADRMVLMPEFKVRTGKAVALECAAQRIEAAFPGVEKRVPEDVSIIVRKVEAAAQADEWAGVSSGDVSIAVYADLEGKAALSIELKEFLDRELKVTTNPMLLDALCRGYLVSWIAGSEKTKALAVQLVNKAQLLPIRWRKLFTKCADFLNPVHGCTAVGEHMIDAASPYNWLKEIGLPSPHEEGFMLEAHREFLRLTPEPKTEQSVDKLLAWVSPQNQPEMHNTRAAEVVEKILSPWVSVGCPEGLREHCVDRLVKLFGDPRKEREAFWALVEERHRCVMLKWLAGKSMEAIFEIVTQTESGSEHGHQWAKRKRFWMGVYDQGRIDEAWVALGNKAIPIAKDLHSRSGDPSFLSFGRQGRRDTCLLFMRIGEKIFVEGSHNFRVHMFPTPTRATPVLYAKKYDLEEIMLPKQHQDARVHDSGDNWMGWVQGRIKR